MIPKTNGMEKCLTMSAWLKVSHVSWPHLREWVTCSTHFPKNSGGSTDHGPRHTEGRVQGQQRISLMSLATQIVVRCSRPYFLLRIHHKLFVGQSASSCRIWWRSVGPLPWSGVLYRLPVITARAWTLPVFARGQKMPCTVPVSTARVRGPCTRVLGYYVENTLPVFTVREHGLRG